MPTPDGVPNDLKPASGVINTAQDVIDKIPSLIPLEPCGIFNSDRSDIRAENLLASARARTFLKMRRLNGRKPVL